MNVDQIQKRWEHACWGIVVFLGIISLISCSASDEPPFGGRIESPTKANPPIPTPASSPSASSSLADAHPGPPYPTGIAYYPFPPYKNDLREPIPPSQWFGLKLSPLDKIIADTCPEQPWSQKVPDVDCTSDSDCGDGFCDRGHCEQIWTCGERLGQRCETDKQCGGLCIGGRCQGCLFNAECEKKLAPMPAVCNLPSIRGRGRTCVHDAIMPRHGPERSQSSDSEKPTPK